MRWLCSAKVSSVWVHRTVRWCTGLFGGAPDSVRCARLALANSLLSGIQSAAYDYNSPDCPVCIGLSGEPTVGRANGRLRDLCETRGRANGRERAPNCPVCTGLSGESTVGRANGRLRDLRETRGRANGRERAPDCPERNPHRTVSGVHRTVSGVHRTVSGVHRTVRCARRQKARIAFLECTQRLLAALGL
jgi:hypothetical protein